MFRQDRNAQQYYSPNVDGGKEPAWINPVVLTYFDELNISIQAFDEDVSENEFIGTAKI
jgi:hypothetical protein